MKSNLNPLRHKLAPALPIPSRASDCTLSPGAIKALHKRNIKPQWDTAFQYAGKAAPVGPEGESPKVPKRPEDVRPVLRNGQADVSSGLPEPTSGTTGMIASGAFRLNREMHPQQPLSDALPPNEGLGSFTGEARSRLKDSQSRLSYEVLDHHLKNHGAGPVQDQLPYRPHEHKMDMPEEVWNNNRTFYVETGKAHAAGPLDESTRRRMPPATAYQNGEFIMVSKGDGAEVTHLGYHYGTGASVPPDQLAQARFITHSHLFDPHVAQTRENLHRRNYPSGGDYHSALELKMKAEARPGEFPDTTSILMHRHQFFEIASGNGLQFSGLPMGKEQTAYAREQNIKLSGPNPTHQYFPKANNPAAFIKSGQPGAPMPHSADGAAVPPQSLPGPSRPTGSAAD